MQRSILWPENIKLRFSPGDENSNSLLLSTGNKPLLDLTLKTTKNWKSVSNHLENKWRGIENFKQRLVIYFVDTNGVFSSNLALSPSKLSVGESLCYHPVMLQCVNRSLNSNQSQEIVAVVPIYYMIQTMSQQQSDEKQTTENRVDRSIITSTMTCRGQSGPSEHQSELKQQQQPVAFTSEDSLFDAINAIDDFSLPPQKLATASEVPSQSRTTALPVPVPSLFGGFAGDLSLLAAGINFDSDSFFTPLECEPAANATVAAAKIKHSSRMAPDVYVPGGLQPIGTALPPAVPASVKSNVNSHNTKSTTESGLAAPVRIFDLIRSSMSCDRLSPLPARPQSSTSLSENAVEQCAAALNPVASHEAQPLFTTEQAAEAVAAEEQSAQRTGDSPAEFVKINFPCSYRRASRQVSSDPATSSSPATITTTISDTELQVHRLASLSSNQGALLTTTANAAASPSGEDSGKRKAASSAEDNPVGCGVGGSGAGTEKKKRPKTGSSVAVSSSSSVSMRSKSFREAAQQDCSEDSYDFRGHLALPHRLSSSPFFTLPRPIATVVKDLKAGENSVVAGIFSMRREGRTRPDLKRITPTLLAPLNYRDLF